MNVLDIVTIITVTGSFFLGTIALRRTASKTVRYSFALLVFSISGWIVSLDILYGQYFGIPLLTVGRWNFAFGLLVGYFALRFTYYFPKKTVRKFSKRFNVLFHLWMITMFFITLLTPLIDENERLVNGEVVTDFGPLYFLYLLTLAFCMGGGVYLLVVKFRHLDGIYRKQISYFLIGFLLSFFFVSITNLILPQFGNFSFQQIAPIFTLFFLGFTFYAIVRYRLLNVKIILTRSLLYLILTVGISVLFIVLFLIIAGNVEALGVNQYLIWAAVALIIVVGLDPLKRLLARTTDRLFYKNKIDYNAELKRISNLINSEVDLKELIEDFSTVLAKRLKLRMVNVLICADEDRVYLPLDYYVETLSSERDFDEEKLRLYSNSAFIHFLRQEKSIIVTDEIDRQVYDNDNAHEQARLTAVLGDLEELKAGAAIPVERRGNMTAIILIGRKASGETFTNQDISLFEVLANQLAAGLERSKLYQKVQTFNMKLQEEVDRQTKELKGKNIELEEANEHLKKLDQAKSEFMSIASHQLRTPLTGIVGYLSMIKDESFGKLNNELSGVVENVSAASERLVRLVNTLLSVTQIEAGRFVINFSQGDIVALVAKEVHDLMPTAEAKDITLTFEQPAKEIILSMDPDKIRDVVINLVDNAIKYTEEGGKVTVHLQREGNGVKFCVEDTGIGIPADEAKKLFSKFVRGEGMAQVHPDGSGLGLYIVKKIVEGHKGKVWAQSEGKGKGTIFHVELPNKPE